MRSVTKPDKRSETVSHIYVENYTGIEIIFRGPLYVNRSASLKSVPVLNCSQDTTYWCPSLIYRSISRE